MAGFFTVVANSLGRGYLFSQVTRYVNPELLSAAMFVAVLAGMEFLPYSLAEGVSHCVILEFLMIHANVGMAGARFFASSAASKKKLLLMVGGFYFIFVGALAFGIGAWWTALCFVLLTWKRLNEPYKEGNKASLMSEIVVTMARFAVYMLTGLIGAGIGVFMGSDDVFKMLLWGSFYYLALYLFRNKLEQLREAKLFDRSI